MALFSAFAFGCLPSMASEADLIVPKISEISPDSYTLLLIGLGISVVGLLFGLWKFLEIKKVEVHTAMASVGNTISKHVKLI